MRTTTMTPKARICSLLILLSQCVMFADAQFGRKKRQEREGGPAAAASILAAPAVEEEMPIADDHHKLLTHGHESNGMTVYILTGLLALAASAIAFYSATRFSFSVTSRSKPPGVGKMPEEETAPPARLKRRSTRTREKKKEEEEGGGSRPAAAAAAVPDDHGAVTAGKQMPEEEIVPKKLKRRSTQEKREKEEGSQPAAAASDRAATAGKQMPEETAPRLKRRPTRTDTVVVREEKRGKEEESQPAAVTACEESAVTASDENAASAHKEDGRKEKAVPVLDEANAQKHAEGGIATADVRVERAAPVPSIITDTIETYFPGAMTGPSLAKSIESALARNGYDKDRTLLATSLCCDEVNRMLEKDIASVYGDHFSMGGLAGFAFGGITSFGAMAHHIPDGGSCVIMYGPHVGVDDEGKVGTVNRRGRANGGACCGSAKAAAGYVKNKSAQEIVELESPTKALDAFTQRYLELKTSGRGRTGRATSIASGCVKKVGPKERKELEAQTEALDAQQTFVGNMLLPFSKRLEEAEQPDVELPFSLFDAQDEFMKAIVAKGCGNVAGEGKIALLGGIQINTPGDYPEFFLPLVFEIRNNKGELVADLIRLLESS